MSEMGLVPVQLLSFLWSIALGAALGLLYDCFRVLRLAFPSPPALVAVQDIVFGLLASAISFGYLMTVSDGKLRFFLFLGEAVGWALYYATVGDIVMALSGAIIGVISMILRFLWRVVTTVLTFVRRVAKVICRLIGAVLLRPIVAVLRWVKKRLNLVYIRAKIKVKASKSKIFSKFGLPKLRADEKKLKKRIKPKIFLQRKA